MIQGVKTKSFILGGNEFQRMKDLFLLETAYRCGRGGDVTPKGVSGLGKGRTVGV